MLLRCQPTGELCFPASSNSSLHAVMGRLYHIDVSSLSLIQYVIIPVMSKQDSSEDTSPIFPPEKQGWVFWITWIGLSAITIARTVIAILTLEQHQDGW